MKLDVSEDKWAVYTSAVRGCVVSVIAEVTLLSEVVEIMHLLRIETD